ncbi:hypothetical protein CYLTODRAFT_421646 [Cylindrobasidium torrendii FP15055 ss-10]|uniref:RlpA-like protein double-psi beta-barrel domain-containing protein n=1 Tax=Cylindrobasidium torrendii FP15055 ss-10 TaxID=1314674 RepID=A0A0D7BD51_9AGAR|nr:hypothetical protein CYLTODRAFT_421646 [Cylindrobasidium torrendii FP15055 ss-10]
MFAKLASFIVLGLSATVFAAPTETGLVPRSNVGEVTYYDPGLGACGITSSAAELVAAVPTALYDSYPGATPNPNLNPICGKKIRATYNGRSVDVTVVDKCYGCKGTYDIDMTQVAMRALVDDPVAAGRLFGVSWDWL